MELNIFDLLLETSGQCKTNCIFCRSVSSQLDALARELQKRK